MKRPIRRRLAGLALVDLLVVAVLIPLMCVVYGGCRRRHSYDSSRVRCAANLKSIGQALLLYANDNKGAYPRTKFASGSVVIPTWGTGAGGEPEPNDVTAAMYLLIRTQEITSDVFICPRSTAERWDFGGEPNTAMSWSNWQGRDGILKHLSYSFQNPYPDNDAVAAGFDLSTGISAEFAVAADMNPGTAGNNQDVLAVTIESSNAHVRQANSLNHDQDGQNVLYGDGHVEYQITPFAGLDRDNIYARRAGASGYASIDVRNSSRDAKDSVLLPTDD